MQFTRIDGKSQQRKTSVANQSRRWLLLLLGLVVMPSVPVFAANSWESLITPGPLVKAHAELEGGCSECHATFSNTTQQQLCVDCHEDIASDIASDAGFHGKNPLVGEKECRACHTEHIGADADITGLNVDIFDHTFTDFPLEGSHKIQACSSCHAQGEKYREQANTCVDCHESVDPHKGSLGQECSDCHNPLGWLEISFDHEEKSGYKLVGAHQQEPCGSCHVDQHFEDTPNTCIDCHNLDDVHKGTRGNECESCHTEQSWEETSFEHEEATDFALLGAHEELTCNACHLDNMSLEKPPLECNGCHSSNDPHRGSRGAECGDCHNNNSWEISFSHEQETGFALLGAHNELQCEQCHVNNLTDPMPQTCEECHKESDPHQGTLGACDSCHGASSWTNSVRFDHEFTNFPLFGLHRLATCEQCHLTRKFDETEPECNSCHAQVDPHDKTFGNDCESCHNPGGWELWQFDHDRQTAFALSGSHSNLICAACHSTDSGPAGNLSQQCSSCHIADDIHNGQFGDQCNRCHTTESFKDNVRFR